MSSLNEWFSSVCLAVVILLMSSGLAAEVLELGESQLHGKKDQPEAMTFVSRAPLEVSESRSVWEPVESIKKEISRDIFNARAKEF